MKEAIGMVVGVVITLVSLVSFIDNTFVPYREQQAFMAQSNQQMLEALNGELNNATTGTITVRGSSVRATINGNIGKSNIEIYVNGTKWDGKVLGSSNVTVDDSVLYTRATESPNSDNGNKTIYRYQASK